MTKFIYARVSTSEKGQTVENQIHAITEAHNDCYFIRFCDDGYSGTVNPAKRPSLSRLLNLVKPGDTILIAAFDRLSRDTLTFLSLIEQLRAKGVSLVSLRERIDTTTSQGYLMATQFMAFAKYERDLISERTQASLNRLKASGKQLGKPTQGNKQNALQMLSEGVAVSVIVAQTGVSRATVFRLKKSL